MLSLSSFQLATWSQRYMAVAERYSAVSRLPQVPIEATRVIGGTIIAERSYLAMIGVEKFPGLNADAVVVRAYLLNHESSGRRSTQPGEKRFFSFRDRQNLKVITVVVAGIYRRDLRTKRQGRHDQRPDCLFRSRGLMERGIVAKQFRYEEDRCKKREAPLIDPVDRRVECVGGHSGSRLAGMNVVGDRYSGPHQQCAEQKQGQDCDEEGEALAASRCGMHLNAAFTGLYCVDRSIMRFDK